MKTLPVAILLFFACIGISIAQEKELTLAERYNQTADSLSELSDFQKAILYRKKALNIYQNLKPVPFHLVVMEYRSLGIYYRRLGKFQDCEYHQKRAVEIAEQHLDTNHPERAKAYNSYGIFFLTQGKFNLALDYLNRSLTINRKINAPEVADNLNNIGILFENQGEYEKAREHYALAKTFNLASNGLWDLKTADNFINLGTASFQLGDYDLALAYLDTSLLILDSLLPENHPDFAGVFNNIGAVYNIKGDYREAINNFDRALTCYQSNQSGNTPEIANIYANIGLLSMDRGDLDKALIHFQKAYNIRVAYFGAKHHLVARTCNYLGDCYIQKKNLETAFDWFSKALDIYQQLPSGNPADWSEYLSDMGLYFEKMGNSGDALIYYNRALDALGKRKTDNNPDVANLFIRIGNVYLEKAETATANDFFQKALRINQNIFGQKHPEVARAFTLIAKACFPDEICVMEYCDSAFAAINFPKDASPNFAGVTSPIVLLEILQTKAGLLQRFYEETKEAINLEDADRVYQYAIQLIDFIKTSLEEPGSRQALLDNFFLLYEDAIAVKCELNAATEKPDYLHEAFNIAERSSSILLLEALQSIEVEQFAGIPDSLLKLERNLKIDLAFYEKELFEEELKGSVVDRKRLNRISDKILALQKKHSGLMEVFRQKFPHYFELKYAPKIVTVDEIQRKLLRKDQTMLAYFVGETNLFVFVISKDQFEVVPIKKDFPLEIWVEEFRNSIYRYNPLSREVEYLNQKYANIGYELYQLIFEPVKAHLKNRDLVVIPGGVLGYLPFDAMLSEPTEAYDNFDNHPYLVKDYQFSYCYSASLLKEMTGQRDGWRRGGFMAFAPSYSGDSLTIRSDPWRAVLGQLRFNILESRAIQRIMGGKVFTDTAATEENFRRYAPGAGILHLAAHAKANDEHGEYSYLAFYQTLDSIENELIFVKDLYTMRIRAALVVLSACETGIGELQRGEGIVSLARGFSYAGAASIVTTMWSIDDNASAEIMETFYGNLKSGATIDKALRDTKIAFLNRKKGTNATHPLYWAAFVPVGDMSSLGNGWEIWIRWIFLPAAAFLLFFIWKKWNRKVGSLQKTA